MRMEGDGLMKYYFPELGMVADDAYGPIGQDCNHSSWCASEAMDHHHSHHDGWELKEANFPIKVVLVDDMGVESTWKVARDIAPVFIAYKLENDS